MTARALLHAPATAARGAVVEIRATLQHPMETGYRSGADGQPLPRKLVRRVEAHFEGERVFAADLHAAVAANPTVAFALRLLRSGTLSVSWQGDDGLSHTESAPITVA